MKVSVVIPVFQEQDNIQFLADEFAPLIPRLPGLEVLLVDDGSTDATWSRMVEAGQRHPFVRGLRADRNRGQSAAMLLGLRHASGDILVTMDGDLQNNPADIPTLVQALERADVVCGYRATRRDSISRRWASKIGNAIRNAVTHDGLRDTGCSLKAFRTCCVDDLPPVNGVHRFMGAYFRLAGRTIEQLPVDHRPRTHGVSKYTNLKRLPRTAFDLIGFLWYRSRVLRDLRLREQTRA